MQIELSFRTPLDPEGLVAFFGRRAVDGVERVAGGAYARSLGLAGGPATIELRGDGDRVLAEATLTDDGDRVAAEAAARRLFDLDADPGAIAAALGDDPLLGPMVGSNPGRRVPGHPDPVELAIRAVIGQQISLGAARTVAARLVAEHGEPLPRPLGTVTHLFPGPATLAALEPAQLPMPRPRARALSALAAALASGEIVLDPAADPEPARERLLALPGIGPWTVAYIEMRGLGNRDAFLASDLGVRRALEALNRDGDPASATRLGQRWHPYRAYALQHLWASLETNQERRIT